MSSLRQLRSVDVQSASHRPVAKNPDYAVARSFHGVSELFTEGLRRGDRPIRTVSSFARVVLYPKPECPPFATRSSWGLEGSYLGVADSPGPDPILLHVAPRADELAAAVSSPEHQAGWLLDVLSFVADELAWPLAPLREAYDYVASRGFHLHEQTGRKWSPSRQHYGVLAFDVDAAGTCLLTLKGYDRDGAPVASAQFRPRMFVTLRDWRAIKKSFHWITDGQLAAHTGESLYFDRPGDLNELTITL